MSSYFYMCVGILEGERYFAHKSPHTGAWTWEQDVKKAQVFTDPRNEPLAGECRKHFRGMTKGYLKGFAQLPDVLSPNGQKLKALRGGTW